MKPYYFVIALTFIGFVTLAAILLVPVYLFLKKEEDVARHWTDETIAQVPEESANDAPEDDSRARSGRAQDEARDTASDLGSGARGAGHESAVGAGPSRTAR